MIRIKKDNNELEVSKNAYETMYKRLGYQVVGKKFNLTEPLKPNKDKDKEKVSEK